MKELYLVIGTIDRSLRWVEFFSKYEEAAEFINGILLEACDHYDNAIAEMQYLRLQKGEPQDDDYECHLIDVKNKDMEAWHNHYDTDFYICEISGDLGSFLSKHSEYKPPLDGAPWYKGSDKV